MRDLHRFDPMSLEWADITSAVSGPPPSPRARMGFAAAGAMLYVFGGEDATGYLPLHRTSTHKRTHTNARAAVTTEKGTLPVPPTAFTALPTVQTISIALGQLLWLSLPPYPSAL